jgi:hypothetical protein
MTKLIDRNGIVRWAGTLINGGSFDGGVITHTLIVDPAGADEPSVAVGESTEPPDDASHSSLYTDSGDGKLKAKLPDNSVIEVGGSSFVRSADFALTAAQLRASTLAPTAIVPSAGADTLLVPFAFAYAYTFVATIYSGDAVELVYGTQNLNALFAVLTATEDEVGWVLGAGLGEAGSPANYFGQPIRLRASLRGVIAASAIGTPGGGYAPGDTGTVDDGAPDATYVIDTVGVGGGVSGFTLTDAGDGYNLSAGGAPSQWTTTPGGAQPGVGAGFEISVSAVDASGDAGDGTLAGTVYYVVRDFA